MAFILAVQPDPQQAPALERALRQLMNVQTAVIDSKEAALAVVDKRVPDLILLPALMAPGDEEHLAACFRALPDAGHVQTIRIPHLQLVPPSDAAHPKRRWIRPAKSRPQLSLGCDPRTFAADILEYLSRAHARKMELEQKKMREHEPASERRQAPRWRPADVPWISAVKLAAGERADLVDISAGGALLRSYDRPQLPSRKDQGLDSGPRPGLTLHLASGEDIHVVGRITRCHAVSAGDGAPRYNVALRFDESVGLFLPAGPLLAPETIDHEMHTMVVEVPHSSSAMLDQWDAW